MFVRDALNVDNIDGNDLKVIRNILDLSQEDIAKELGITKQAISLVESGYLRKNKQKTETSMLYILALYIQCKEMKLNKNQHIAIKAITNWDI